MRKTQGLARDVVESMTEYDLGDLPPYLQHELEVWWAHFLQWDRQKRQVIEAEPERQGIGQPQS